MSSSAKDALNSSIFNDRRNIRYDENVLADAGSAFQVLYCAISTTCISELV